MSFVDLERTAHALSFGAGGHVDPIRRLPAGRLCRGRQDWLLSPRGHILLQIRPTPSVQLPSRCPSDHMPNGKPRLDYTAH
jgi:hypothetical protein